MGTESNASAASGIRLDPAAWLDRHGDALFGYALQRVSDRELAADLVQDCLLSAWKNRAAFRGESTERTWLIAILKRRVIDHYRSRESRRVIREADHFHDGGDTDGQWIEQEQPAAMPDADLRDREFRTVLQHCLDDLPGQHAIAFRMRYLDDAEATSICQHLGISSSNYWVILHRARLALQRCLKTHWI